MDAERERQAEQRRDERRWDLFGPYLSERAWATVREDYSADGDAWAYFPHEHARSRVYRWNEDGLCGISDDRQRLCLALALWNGADEILKERLFGLTGPQGNHGEDVKECYWYLDSTPTHSYMRALYRYPQRAYPYAELVAAAAARGRHDPELELVDTGIFDDDRFFDVEVEYAKAAPDDLLMRVTVTNHGPDPAPLHLLPTLWFRNTWSWGRDEARAALAQASRGLHNADEAVLREAVAAATLGTAQSALALHEAERWRAELIASDDAMTRWMAEHPDTDTQQMRSLVRAARRDAAGLVPEDRQPKSFRELFQFIKPML